MTTTIVRRLHRAVPFLFAVAVVFGFGGAHHTHFPSIGKVSTVAPTPVVEHPISDEYVRAYVLAHEGPALAARMITRYHPEQDPRPAPVSYFPTPRTEQIWGGYITDVSGAFVHRVNGASGYFTAIWDNCTFFCPTVGTWAGIGGVNGSGHLAQTGLDNIAMRAWYEFYPPSPAQYLFSVNNGDSMYAKVQWDAGTALWMIYVSDLSTGVYYSSEFSYDPDLTTAEWITEVTGGAVPAIGGIPFSSVRWYDENNYSRTVSN